MSLTLPQQTALALLPKITGGLSCMFSLIIVVAVLRNHNRRKLCYHRLLCGISLIDATVSFFMFLSTWPMPRGTDEDVVWAAGNRTTCRMQGFFIQFSIASPIYNASLAIYYWLVTVKGWKEMHLHKIEWMMHLCPLLWGLGTACTGLLLDVYGVANLWCWADKDFPAFRMGAFYIPLWTQIAICTTACVSIYAHVRRYGVVAHIRQRQKAPMSSSAHTPNRPLPQEQNQEQPEDSFSVSDRGVTNNDELKEVDANQQFDNDNVEEVKPEYYVHSTVSLNEDDGDQEIAPSHHGNAQLSHERRIVMSASFRENLRHNRYVHQQSRRMREIAHQCFYYAGAFYINFAAVSAMRVIQIFHPDKVFYPLLLVAATTVPIQGLPNFLIYLRPRFVKMTRRFLSRPCCRCLGRKYEEHPPWWYQLAASLSGHRPSRSPGEERREGLSSAGVINANPAMLNDVSFRPRENSSAAVHSPQSTLDAATTVLVVVDTGEGRHWKVESNSDQRSNTTSSRGLRSHVESLRRHSTLSTTKQGDNAVMDGDKPAQLDTKDVRVLGESIGSSSMQAKMPKVTRKVSDQSSSSGWSSVPA